jgi:hypothetical protein
MPAALGRSAFNVIVEADQNVQETWRDQAEGRICAAWDSAAQAAKHPGR